jgi:nickel/cobalt exporter
MSGQCGRARIAAPARAIATTTGGNEPHMQQGLFYLASSFWAGAVHAATPGHGKTIAAAYIVGARGRPIDAVILGVFVTLSHVSGIVLVGVLASLGSAWLVPARTEATLALAMGVLVIGLGVWMLWTQRALIGPALAAPRPAGLAPAPSGHPHHHHHHDHDGHDHAHDHHFAAAHEHDHAHDSAGVIWHSHGWGTRHAHRIDVLTAEARPKLAVLITLSIAGGILPDPAALAILLAALSSGRVVLGMLTVLVFSLGFAAALVAVGVLAAQIGRRVLGWLDSIWAMRLQLATTVLIIAMGVWLTTRAAERFAAIASP